jgi:tripartite-type tricarboxylate transporter receptor subunit TctC
MHRLNRRTSIVSLVALALSSLAHAQDIPARGLRIIVPTSTGTASDLSARFIAEQLTKDLAVPVVVDNKPGANGILAVQQFMAAPADGTTLLLTASGLYANPALYKNVPYDPVRDFKLVAPVNEALFVLVSAPAFPPANVTQLIELAKAKPGEVTYASASVGSSTHLGPELFASRAGIQLRHIPYKGGAQAIMDTAGGQVNIAMTAVPTAAPLIKAGRLKALAVTGSRRSNLLPDVPTLSESGVSGAEISSRQALAVPSATPDAMALRLSSAITRVTASAEYARFLESQGLEKEPMAAELYARTGPTELRRWAEMVRISGAKLE